MPSRTEYLDAVVDIEQRIGARSQDATTLWCGELGRRVAQRPDGVLLAHIVAAIVAATGVRRSQGYLSKAATVFTYLVEGLGMQAKELGRFNQSDLYAAAVAVRDGLLDDDAAAVADALAAGNVPTNTKHRAPSPRPRPERRPEPTPDARTLLALEVLTLCERGAEAAGVPVLTWAEDRVADAILAAS